MDFPITNFETCNEGSDCRIRLNLFKMGGGETKKENPHSRGSDAHRWKEILQRKGLTKLHIYS
jgi:hypothetical protein